MMRFKLGRLGLRLALAAGLAGVGLAHAQSTVPVYDTFANLSGADLAAINFNGTGLAGYGPVALTKFGSVTLALAATPRYTNPPVWPSYAGPAVTNDGLGTYFAQVGESPNPGSNNATWNFSYAILGNTTGLKFGLFVDVNPSVNTPSANYLNFSLLLGAGGSGSSAQNTQDSQNIGFYDGLGPTPYSFNPFTQGEYMVSLRAFDASNNPVDEVAIRVTVVPEPEAYGLALAGMGVVLLSLRRRRSSAVVST